jgi:hypothetical protein
MEAKLVVVGGKANKEEIPLKLPIIIGRSREAGLTISHPMISRRHCEVFEADGLLMIRDLGSLNGTVIGGQQVKESPLPPDGQFTIGPLTFRAEYEYKGDLSKLPAPVLAEPGVAAARAGSPNGRAADESGPFPSQTVDVAPGEVDPGVSFYEDISGAAVTTPAPNASDSGKKEAGEKLSEDDVVDFLAISDEDAKETESEPAGPKTRLPSPSPAKTTPAVKKAPAKETPVAPAAQKAPIKESPAAKKSPAKDAGVVSKPAAKPQAPSTDEPAEPDDVFDDFLKELD